MAVRGGGRAVLGFGFMATGAVFVWGGLTGRLAPMLAALFAPDDLAPSGSGSAPPAAAGGSYAGPGVNPYPGVPTSPLNPYGYTTGG